MYFFLKFPLASIPIQEYLGTIQNNQQARK